MMPATHSRSTSRRPLLALALASTLTAAALSATCADPAVAPPAAPDTVCVVLPPVRARVYPMAPAAYAGLLPTMDPARVPEDGWSAAVARLLAYLCLALGVTWIAAWVGERLERRRARPPTGGDPRQDPWDMPPLSALPDDPPPSRWAALRAPWPPDTAD